MEDNDSAKQKEYESYLMDLKSGDRSRYDEAIEKASSIASKKDRKPYHDTLLNAVLQKVAEGPANEESSWTIRFVKQLERGYSTSSDFADFDHLNSVLDRITAMPDANIYTRKLALQTLFDIPHRISKNTVEVVKSSFDSMLKNQNNSFENSAIEMATEHVKEGLGSQKAPDSPEFELFNVVTDALINGDLEEGKARSFVITLKKEWSTDDEAKVLERVRDSSSLPEDIKYTANHALRNAH